MKLKDIIQRVLSHKNGGVQTDDNRLRPRHIYNKLVTVRGLLFNQKANKRQFIGQSAYQYLPCVEMIKAPLHECPCAPPSGCTILRSKHTLPEILTDNTGDMIKTVSSLDGDMIFSKTTWNEKKYKKGNKYTGNKPDYFIRDNYLYVTQPHNSPGIVSLEAVFKDPLEAYNFLNFCEEDCKDCKNCDSVLEKEFPIDSSMEEALITMSSEELVDKGRVSDKLNDGVDEQVQS